MAKKKRKTDPAQPREQYAALPFRVRDGHPEFLLVTSRETRRWIIPKGWPEKNHEPWEMAAREAYEEAGVLGRVDAVPVGSYVYDKVLSPKKSVQCQVQVFPLEVAEQLPDWPERTQRECRWCTPGQAALLVDEPGLVELLLRFGAPDPRE